MSKHPSPCPTGWGPPLTFCHPMTIPNNQHTFITYPMISSSTWLCAAVTAGPLTAQCNCTVLLLRLGCDTTSTDRSYVPELGSTSLNRTWGPISCAVGSCGILPVKTQPLLLTPIPAAAAACGVGTAVPAAVLKLGAYLLDGVYREHKHQQGNAGYVGINVMLTCCESGQWAVLRASYHGPKH